MASKPRVAAMGVNRGTMMRTMPIQSMNIPRMKTMSIIATRTPHLPKGAASRRFFTKCPPPRPINTEVNMLAPSTTNIIMLVTLSVR